MGCFWSDCGDEHDRCLYCNRRAVNNLVLINNVCEICTSQSQSRSAQSHRLNRLQPYYGEYRCSCGRFWSSRYSRAGVYQMCERCRAPVYPTNMRELRASDNIGDRENREEHKIELCQMCQQLGFHCGQFGQRNQGRSRSRSRSRNRQNRY